MIPYVDLLLKEWAEQSVGGLPRQSGGSVLAARVEAGYSDMSDEAYEIEIIVQRMPSPWCDVVRIHYRHASKSLDERIEKMSLVAPPSRKVFRGSDKARADRAVRYLMGTKKYYALLHQSHEIVDRELKSKNN